MSCLRRVILVTLVLLTAASTLLAGLPHFDCVCPNGQHTSYCLGSVFSKEACCCSGACCTTDQPDRCAPEAVSKKVERPPTPPCCQHPKEEGDSSRAVQQNAKKGPPQTTSLSGKAKAKPHALQLKSTGCAKTLSRTEALAAASCAPSAKLLTAVDLGLLSPASVCAASLPAAVRAPLLWLPHAIPPPTDLIIALQHFLI